MRRQEDIINLGITLFFVAGFLFLVYFDDVSIVGFTIKEFDKLDIDGQVSVILTLKDDSAYSEKDTSKTQQDKFVKINDLSLDNDYDNINAISVKINKADLEKIIKDPNLESITLDQIFTISLDSSKSVINADLVWDKLSKGVSLTGSGSVCVLDTGVDYTHPNLNVINGYDFVNDDSDPMDDNGHGTHIAGTIVSNDSVNRGIAFTGKVVAMKVMSASGSGDGADIIDGIDWCISNKDLYNISVISMSIGSDTLFSDYCDDAYQPMTDIINKAVLNDIMVVSASANNHNSGALPLPACIRNVTSVGAVDDNDNVASFSNSASILDLLGPGVSITSTYPGGFSTLSGTSMAVPHISAGALIIKQYSDLELLNLNVFDIINIMKENGESILDTRNGYSFPRLDIFRTLVSLDIFEPLVNSYYSPLEVYDDKNVELIANASDTFLDSSMLELGNESYFVDWYVLNDLQVGENITFRFSANDSAGNLKIGDYVSFIVLDGSPVLEDVERLTGVANKTFNYNIIASDPTNDDLIYGDDTELFDIDSTGLISFVPGSVGNYSVNISVSDGKHLVFDNFILEILLNNTKPEIISYSPLNLSLSINENESLEFSVDYEDLDGGSLNVNWYLDGVLVGNNDNYNFVSDYSSAGDYNITVTISDGIDSDNLEWNLKVNNIDLVPVLINNLENISWNENTNYSLDLSSYFVDLDGDSLSYNMSFVDNISFDGSVLISDLDFDGNREVKFYVYDPSLNFAESNFVTLTVNNVHVCGDNVLEGTEECDNPQLNNKSCLDYDYDSGSLGCNSECKFDYSGCVITQTSSSSGSAPSSGGGTPTGGNKEETVEVKVEKKEEKVVVKASNIEEEKPLEGTGSIVKEQEMKPKQPGRVKTFFVKMGNFFKFIWYSIIDLFR